MKNRLKILFVFVVVCLAAVLAAKSIYFNADKREVLRIYTIIDGAEYWGDYTNAYALMTEHYKANHSYTNFSDYCHTMGVIESPTIIMNWSKTTAQVRPAYLCGGAVLQFLKTDAGWRCDGITDWWYD